MDQQLETPLARFLKFHKDTPDRVFLSQPVKGEWHEYTYQKTWHQAACLANYLNALPEKSHVAIYSLNCADWVIADLAIQMAGHICVPIYPTAGKSTIEYILNHAAIELAFCGKLFDWQDKKSVFENITCLSIYDTKSDMSSLAEIVADQSEIKEVSEASLDELATIVYTSGTTGDPKGVMISHRAITQALKSVEQTFALSTNDRFFSYLPLAHIAERMVVEMAALYFGSSIHFVESLDHFAENLQTAKPTVFFAVPRIWYKLKEGVEKKLGGAKICRILFQIPWLGQKLRKTIKARLGLSETRLALSGAASLPPSIIEWFENLGVEICEAYGLTETCGFSHINLPGNRKAGTVGQPFANAKYLIADNKELLLSNPSLMMGYFKEPELTAVAIQDDWFRTGDLAEVDEQGFLKITGRVKEIFKTAKGKYISPVPIENRLQPLLKLEHLCVMGSDMPFPIALGVILQPMNTKAKKQYEAEAERVLAQVNASLEKHDRIKKLILVDEDWTTENNMMTPTLKLKRQVIEDRYHPLLVESLDNKRTVQWHQTEQA